jgi:hypothetical protein
MYRRVPSEKRSYNGRLLFVAHLAPFLVTVSSADAWRVNGVIAPVTQMRQEFECAVLKRVEIDTSTSLRMLSPIFLISSSSGRSSTSAPQGQRN